MSTKHTTEPWVVHESDNAFIVAPPETDATVIACVGTTIRSGTISRARTSEANAARIVQCINACKGKKDPQAYMDAVDAVLRAFDVADVEPHQRHALEALRALGATP